MFSRFVTGFYRSLVVLNRVVRGLYRGIYWINVKDPSYLLGYGIPYT